MSVAKTLSPIVDFVFPPRCPLCGEGIAAQAGLCLGCWDELVIPGKPCCQVCARPFGDAPRSSEVCGQCRAHPPLHDGIAAATLYNDTSRKLVLAFKHGNRIALAPMMAPWSRWPYPCGRSRRRPPTPKARSSPPTG